jgi:2-phosphosulfolactate phosphatase
MAEASPKRLLHVHLVPELVAPEALRGGVAVVLDVLRATTTMVHALAAGCVAIYPVQEVDEARKMASSLQPRKVLLGGERLGLKIDGFDLGNSPTEYRPDCCRDATLVMTTTNGTRALLRANAAERVLVAGFVNFSATCAELANETLPIHLVCAGTQGEVTLDDTLLAGAFVEALSRELGPPPRRGEKRAPAQQALLLNDGARLAWDCFEHHGVILDEALRLSAGGRRLLEIGQEEDLKSAAHVDRFFLTVELRRDPMRLELGRAGVTRRRWPG